MAGTARPSYGTPNWEMITRWLELAPEDDGPFWALNLMKYHAVAQYGDDGGSSISGRDADDAYSPLGPLAAVGAIVAFHGDVLEQAAGTPSWDRIGIVRYPSRAAFFAMQQRDDFKDQHVHKEAGMECTIVMSCLPQAHDPNDAPRDGMLVLSVETHASTDDAVPAGVTLVADFTVEGVIVGDDRTFARARFLHAADAGAFATVMDQLRHSDGAQLMIVDRGIDRLVESITTAPAGKG